MVISNEMNFLGAGWRFHGWCSNQPSEGFIIWISCKNPYLLFLAHLLFYIVKFNDCLLLLTHVIFCMWNLLFGIDFLSRNCFSLCLTMLRINQQSHFLRWGLFLHIKWLRFSELIDLSISPFFFDCHMNHELPMLKCYVAGAIGGSSWTTPFAHWIIWTLEGSYLFGHCSWFYFQDSSWKVVWGA
jgi:hypothetical protein